MSVYIYNALPKYQSHKIVAAQQIQSISVAKDGSALIKFKKLDYQFPFTTFDIPASSGWMDKHKPCDGGYLVAYEDGYLSYSPQRQFEEGNTFLESGAPADALETSINAMAVRINKDLPHNECMALSQAALNLAHTKEKLAGIDK